jgi:hypothetical protein
LNTFKIRCYVLEELWHKNYPLLCTAAHISNTELEPPEEDPNLIQLSSTLDKVMMTAMPHYMILLGNINLEADGVTEMNGLVKERRKGRKSLVKMHFNLSIS